MAEEWHLFPHFGFRCTGFPFELLERLRFEKTAEAIQGVLELESAIGKTRGHVLSLFPEAVASEQAARRRKPALNLLSDLRAAIARGRMIPPAAAACLEDFGFNSVAAGLAALAGQESRHAQAIEAARRTFDTELAAKRRQLLEIVSDLRFQEALFISNPNMIRSAVPVYLDSFNAEARPAKIRKLERKFVTYLQRLCAKNDTAAFFGPMNTGTIDAAQDGYLRIGIPARRLDSNRMIFFSYWAAQALADAVSADPEVKRHLKPVLNPICQLKDSGEVRFHFLDKSMKLGGLHLALVRAANGARTALDLAADTGFAADVVLPALEKLERARILIWRIVIPSTIFHPFEFLVNEIMCLPEACSTRRKWLDALSEIDCLRNEYRNAALDQRKVLLGRMEDDFARVTGIPPVRSEGDTYADRSIIYEECGGEIDPLVFGRRFAADLRRRLESCLRLCRAYGQTLWEHYQAIGRQALSSLPSNGEVPYSDFVNALKRLEGEPRSGAIENLKAQVGRLVSERSDGHVASLSAADIDAIAGTQPFPRKHYHVSPDVLISAASLDDLQAGRYQIVMGEFHAFMMPWGSQLYFYPRRVEAEQQLAAAIGRMTEYRHLGLLLNVRRHKGLIFESFPGTFFEMFARSSKHGSDGALPISRLTVHFDGTEFRLGEAGGSRRFKIYTGGDEKLNLWIFAPPPVLQPPVSLGKHTPRVEIEGTVFQRERWELPYAEIIPIRKDAAGFDLFLELWRRKTRLGLPDHVFVKSTGEKKPYFVDFTNFFLGEVLCGLPPGDGTLVINEMLPGPKDLWLRDDGGRYCSELRILSLHY
jgi:hypothetical protein